MKKTLSIIVFSLFISLTLTTHVFASEFDTVNNETVLTPQKNDVVLPEAGITPDSFFYTLDILMEKLDLALTKDSLEKLRVMEKNATERLSEGSQMVELGKIEQGKEALSRYKETLSTITSSLDKAINEDKDVSQIIQNIVETSKQVQVIAKKLQTQAEIRESIPVDSIKVATENKLDVEPLTPSVDIIEDINKDLKTIEEIKQIKEVVEIEGYPVITTTMPVRQEILDSVINEKVGNDTVMKRANELGLNPRQILSVKALSENTGLPLDDVLTLFIENGKGIGATVKALNLNTQESLQAIKETTKGATAEIKEQLQSVKDDLSEKSEDETEGSIINEQTSDEGTADPSGNNAISESEVMPEDSNGVDIEDEVKNEEKDEGASVNKQTSLNPEELEEQINRDELNQTLEIGSPSEKTQVRSNEEKSKNPKPKSEQYRGR